MGSGSRGGPGGTARGGNRGGRGGRGGQGREVMPIEVTFLGPKGLAEMGQRKHVD